MSHSSFPSLKKRPWGTNIFNREWDALIILDACRVDALEEIADEYEFLSVDNSITSVGSTSFEWMNHTFSSNHIEDVRDTAYISGNGYTNKVFGKGGETGDAAIPFGPTEYDVGDSGDFEYLEELWRAKFAEESEWMIGGAAGARVHPRYTTDRTIAASRNRQADRLLIHYQYPHDSFPLAENPDLFRPFEAIREGRANREEVWEEYLNNLRIVLDEVSLLLDNIEAEHVVISTDHGEAFGEFGFYRHVIGCPIPCMRNVPWAKTTAKDREQYEPSAPNPKMTNNSTTVEERLNQLGYR